MSDEKTDQARQVDEPRKINDTPAPASPATEQERLNAAFKAGEITPKKYRAETCRLRSRSPKPRARSA